MEISTWHDGHLGVIGTENPPFNVEQTKEIVDLIHRQGGYAIPAHSYSKKKPWANWELNYDGMEVFSFSDFIYERKALELILKALFLSAEQFLKSTLSVNPQYLNRWNQQLGSGKVMAGFGSVDAHIKFRFWNFVPENYLMAFQSVTMYVSAEDKTEKKIIDALIKGRSFIAFEVFGLADKFSFSASKENKSYGAGEVLTNESPIQIMVKPPKAARIKLIHNGLVVAEQNGNILTYQVNGVVIVLKFT